MTADATLRDVSDTALVTAAARARESERARSLFRDPYAGRLAGERGRRLARRLRYRISSTGIVARTAVLDELILDTVSRHELRCVVNLGAGLDTRPYRLALPADMYWVEADQAGILEHKAKLLDYDQPRCHLERLVVDLADPVARGSLLNRIPADGPTLVLTEGLLMYLEEGDVVDLASDLVSRPHFSWWAADLIGTAFVPLANRLGGRQLSAAEVAFRFAPTEGAEFFKRLGWDPTEVRHSWLEQRRLGCEPRWMRAAWAAAPRRLRDNLVAMGVFMLLRRSPSAP